ncbi:MAG: Ig-like domain-containing protein, partial [Armatimonadetes bacterium]|nr:Ig-like domain-containing protein [Candidatus Hippobium faecium]
ACVFANAQTVSEKLEAKALENLFGSGAYLTGAEPQYYHYDLEEGYNCDEIYLRPGDTAIITIDALNTGLSPDDLDYTFTSFYNTPSAVKTGSEVTFTYIAKNHTCDFDGNLDYDFVDLHDSNYDYDYEVDIFVQPYEFYVSDPDGGQVENNDFYVVEQPDEQNPIIFTIAPEAGDLDLEELSVTELKRTGDLGVINSLDIPNFNIQYVSGCGEVFYKITKPGYLDINFSVIFLEIPIAEILVNPYSVSLNPGHSIDLTAEVKPDNATYRENLHWVSDDTSIATVDQFGHVEAVGVGQTEIKCWDKDEKVYGSCAVTVENPNSVQIFDGDVDVTGKTINMSVLDFGTFTSEVKGEGLSQKVTWSTSDWNTVRILSNGAYNAKKYGT